MCETAECVNSDKFGGTEKRKVGLEGKSASFGVVGFFPADSESAQRAHCNGQVRVSTSHLWRVLLWVMEPWLADKS